MQSRLMRSARESGSKHPRRLMLAAAANMLLAALLAPATAWAQDGAIMAWGANNYG